MIDTCLESKLIFELVGTDILTFNSILLHNIISYIQTFPFHTQLNYFCYHDNQPTGASENFTHPPTLL